MFYLGWMNHNYVVIWKVDFGKTGLNAVTGGFRIWFFHESVYRHWNKVNEGVCDEFMSSVNTFSILISSKMSEADVGLTVFIRSFLVFSWFARGKASKKIEWWKWPSVDLLGLVLSVGLEPTVTPVLPLFFHNYYLVVQSHQTIFKVIKPFSKSSIHFWHD